MRAKEPKVPLREVLRHETPKVHKRFWCTPSSKRAKGGWCYANVCIASLQHQGTPNVAKHKAKGGVALRKQTDHADNAQIIIQVQGGASPRFLHPIKSTSTRKQTFATTSEVTITNGASPLKPFTSLHLKLHPQTLCGLRLQ